MIIITSLGSDDVLIHVLIQRGSALVLAYRSTEAQNKPNEAIQMTYRGSQGLAGEAQKKDDPHPHVVCLPAKHRQKSVSRHEIGKPQTVFISVSMPLIVYHGG